MSPEASHPSDALLGLVYGELDRDEAQRVQAHLEGCPACAATVADYRAVRRAAAVLPRELSSPTGLESLLHYGAQAAARVRRRRVALFTGSILSALSAAALVLLILRAPAAQPPASVASNQPQPSQVGALAKNDAPLVSRAEKKQPELASPVPAPSGSAGLQRLAQKPLAPSGAPEKRRARDEVADAEAHKDEAVLGGAAASRASAAAPSGQPAPLAKPAAPAAEAQASLKAVAGAQAKSVVAPAGPPPARAEAAADVSEPTALAKEKAVPAAAADADKAAARVRDEERRALLLQRLETASPSEALPLLAELCPLEVRLQHRADAARVCARVVQTYPGTPEARAAQAQLDTLVPP